MILAEFTMFPADKGESVSAYVSQIIDHIDKSGLKYQLTPMSTILEGEWEEVMNVIGACYKILDSQSNRINVSIKIDSRKGKESRLHSKIEKIESLLGREIKH